MGLLREKRFRSFIYLVTGLIWGILIGALVISVLASYRIDESYKEIIYLENIIIDKEAKLEKIEDIINTQDLVVEDIEVYLSIIGDKLDKIEIEKAVKEKYNNLLGKEVKDVDVDLLTEIIDNRIFKLTDKEYQLKIEKLILTDVLKLYIEVEEIVKS